jgi:transcriptional regulator with XRE-family HTH domain
MLCMVVRFMHGGTHYAWKMGLAHVMLGRMDTPATRPGPIPTPTPDAPDSIAPATSAISNAAISTISSTPISSTPAAAGDAVAAAPYVDDRPRRLSAAQLAQRKAASVRPRKADTSKKKEAAREREARKRAQRTEAQQRLGTTTYRGTPETKAKAAAMVAAGMTRKEVGQALGISNATIGRWLSEAESREIVAATRSQIRANTTESVLALAPKVANRLDAVLNSDELDAKSVDALSRSMLNLEKVSASAAGENRAPAGGGELRVVFPQWARSGVQPEAQPALQRVVDVAPQPAQIDVAPVAPGPGSPENEVTQHSGSPSV